MCNALLGILQDSYDYWSIFWYWYVFSREDPMSYEAFSLTKHLSWKIEMQFLKPDILDGLNEVVLDDSYNYLELEDIFLES